MDKLFVIYYGKVPVTSTMFWDYRHIYATEAGAKKQMDKIKKGCHLSSFDPDELKIVRFVPG